MLTTDMLGYCMMPCWMSIPQGRKTPHPQCFSGHDDLKTDENWPIRAYRAFYQRDKMDFARWNKNRAMPEWLQTTKELAVC